MGRNALWRQYGGNPDQPELGGEHMAENGDMAWLDFPLTIQTSEQLKMA